MKRTFAIWSLCFLLTAVCGQVVAQTVPDSVKKKNFRYSQNPKTKTQAETATVSPNSESNAEKSEPNAAPQPIPEKTIAAATLNVVRTAAKRSIPPTENYVVGPGDILLVSLQNDSKASTYYTVLSDGTIDYPLAGEMVAVSGLSTDEIEDVLASKIKIYENPDVSVKVREFNSHRVTVSGLVENSGERPIQREAVPLFVIRADAVVDQKADAVSVRRANGKAEQYDLKGGEWENVLVASGDIVEFISTAPDGANRASAQFVYVIGEVNSGGQFAFQPGLTLSQAIIVAGGAKRGNVKKAVIRRKNRDGLLVASEFNLRSITDGKVPDPDLSAGDIVEIGN